MDNLTARSSKSNYLIYLSELVPARLVEEQAHRHPKTVATETVSDDVPILALDHHLGVELPLVLLSQAGPTAAVGKGMYLLVVTLTEVDHMGAVVKAAMYTGLSETPEADLAPVPHRDVQAIDSALEDDLPATPVAGIAACVVDRGRVAIVSVPVVQGQGHTLGQGRELVPCRIRPIPDTAGAEAARGQSVVGEGVIVVMTSGTVGQGHHVSCNSIA